MKPYLSMQNHYGALLPYHCFNDAFIGGMGAPRPQCVRNCKRICLKLAVVQEI